MGEDAYVSGIALAPDIDAGQGFLLEVIGTLQLLFVVFFVAVWTAKPLETDLSSSTVSALAPIPIGVCL